MDEARGRPHFIREDLQAFDPRWPLFLRAAHYEIVYELERLLEKHAEFQRLYGA